MGCTAGPDRVSEYDFIRSIADREPDDCRGPMVLLAFSAVRLHALEEAFQSQRASELLWGALVPRSDGDWLTFLLCAVHWMGLASLIAVRAHQYLRGDWLSESSALLHEICDAAAWDPKEIANLLTWQRVQLT